MSKSNTLRISSVVLALAVLVLVNPQSLFGQAAPPRKNPDPAANPKVRATMEAINQRARELGLITASEEDDGGFLRRRMEAQLSEDFARLHTINVEKIAVQASAASVDYKIISEATADIKQRANRIKYNIPILQTAEKPARPHYEVNPDQLASALTGLSHLINGFLDSPVFRLSSPNDGELRAKASRDLDSIIKLSDTINKLAKRMNRVAASSK